MAQQQHTGGDPVRASQIKPRKVDWLWRERIPKGMLTVVAGKPDQGKGLFSAHVAADVSRRGQQVIYSAMEDAADQMTQPRLNAAGADLDNIIFWRFRLPDQIEELAELVIDHEVALVCMDPFAAHLGSGVSRHSDNVRSILQPMSELAEATGVSFLITEHALKRVAANGHPLAAIGGSSSGLPAASRMAYVFGVDPADADRRILCNVKSNLRDAPKALAFDTDSDELDIVGEVPALVVDKEITFDAKRLLTQDGEPGKVGRKPDKRAAAAEWLTQYLAAAGKPVVSGEVMEDAIQHGHTRKTIRNAADDMGIVRNPPGGGRNCTWDLNDEVKGHLGLPVGGGDDE